MLPDLKTLVIQVITFILPIMIKLPQTPRIKITDIS